MSRKQVGSIDSDLLAEVDRRADFLGQTRRVFVERALQDRLAEPAVNVTSAPPGVRVGGRQHAATCKCAVCS